MLLDAHSPSVPAVSKKDGKQDNKTAISSSTSGGVLGVGTSKSGFIVKSRLIERSARVEMSGLYQTYWTYHAARLATLQPPRIRPDFSKGTAEADTAVVPPIFDERMLAERAHTTLNNEIYVAEFKRFVCVSL